MIQGQATGSKVGVITRPERAADGRLCEYCGGRLGDVRPETRFHRGPCLVAARALGWAPSHPNNVTFAEVAEIIEQDGGAEHD